MVEIDPTSLGIEFGAGAGIGAIIGFAAKKIAKLIAVLIGIELALFKFLESRGIISVDWERLTGGMYEATQAANGTGTPSWVNTFLSTLSVSVGFTGGFLLGFRKG